MMAGLDQHSVKTTEAIAAAVAESDDWKMSDWRTSTLVLLQASLKHMLKLVEREMGQRKLISPHRETR